MIERWEMQTLDPILIFSWFIIQTSSPIQHSSPISRFQGKWTRTPLRMNTVLPTDAPKIFSKNGRNDDGRNADLNIVRCTQNQVPSRIFPRRVKFALPENALKSLFTRQVYFNLTLPISTDSVLMRKWSSFWRQLLRLQFLSRGINFRFTISNWIQLKY